jgi:hypothetical protein
MEPPVSSNDRNEPKPAGYRSWQPAETPPTPDVPPAGEALPDPVPADGPLAEAATEGTTRRHRLRDDDLEQRSGHYILSYGLPGAGKTAFQSFLTYYLSLVGPFSTTLRFSPETSAQGWEPQAVVNQWTRDWSAGRFPGRTPSAEDDIRELCFRVVPKRGARAPLEFGFLEVGGELMRRVIVDTDLEPTLSQTLRSYLANPAIDLLLLLVVDPDQGLENDLLFDNLLTHLQIIVPELRSRARLGVLISKPQTALRQLRKTNQGLAHYPELRGELCEDYLRAFAPRTYQLFEDWPNPERTAVMALHLGESAALAPADAHAAAGAIRITSPDYTDIGRIAGWIYRQFTGETLGPTRLQRLLNWLRS